MFKTNKFKKEFRKWTLDHVFQMAVFNILMIFMFLLHSAGYFDPYYEISINFIVVAGLILSIFLLNANSKGLYAVCIFFLAVAGTLKILKLDIWADRTGIYVFQSFFIASVKLFTEALNEGRSRKK